MKAIFAFLFIFSSLAMIPSFAYISGKVPVQEKLIYCPNKIICTRSDFASCDLGNNQHWINKVSGENQIIAGTYNFTGAIGYYHLEQPNARAASCSYQLSSNYTYPKGLWIGSKYEANLEAHIDRNTNWELTNAAPPAKCNSESSISCPLRQGSGFGISFFGKKYTDSFYISANSVTLFENKSMPYIFLGYEKAGSCWSSKQCKIDIDMSTYDLGVIRVGSIIVDMDNKMKIVQIIPARTSAMTIKKIEPFNTIEIKESGKPISPSLEINNSINSEITLITNNNFLSKIPAHDHGNLYSYRAQQACLIKKCPVNLTTSNGGLIGSIVVDIEKSMDIVSMQSTRPSEIRITKINRHKIEVGYSNFR